MEKIQKNDQQGENSQTNRNQSVSNDNANVPTAKMSETQITNKIAEKNNQKINSNYKNTLQETSQKNSSEQGTENSEPNHPIGFNAGDQTSGKSKNQPKAQKEHNDTEHDHDYKNPRAEQKGTSDEVKDSHGKNTSDSNGNQNYKSL